MKFSRRDFLTFAGFTVVGVAGGRYFQNQLLPRESYYLGDDFRSRKEEFLNSTCGMCPANCGIRVRLVDEQAIRIEGNPDCPISQGRLCPKGQMGLELHYNPDRIASPLKRIGSPGSQKWEKVSWDEALDLLSTKIKSTIDKNKSISVLCNEEQSLASNLWRRFQEKYPNNSRITQQNLLRDHAAMSAMKMTTGLTDWPVYDIKNSDFLLVFDTPIVSGWSIAPLIISNYADFRRARDRIRGKMVFVGSRRSMDATNADQMIEVAPYSSAILALGLAYVIIREKRFDEEFVAKYCSGFEEFKTYILKYFKSKTVSEITNVSIETINSLARLFAGSSRPIAIGERIPESSQTWEQAAYLSLNALKGSIGVEGGLRTQNRLNFNNIMPLEYPEINTKDPHQTPLEQLLSEISDDNIPEVLLIDKIDLSSTVIRGKSWTDVLQKIPFTVSFSPYPDASTNYADLILPDLGFLEKSIDVAHASALEYPSISVTNASVSAIGDGFDTRIIQLMLLDDNFINEKKIDKDDSKHKLQKLRKDLHQNIYDSRRGLINDTPFAREWVRRMESGGWWASDSKSFEDFEKKLLAKGGWSDPYIYGNEKENSLLSSDRKFNMANVVNCLPLDNIFSGKIVPLPPKINRKQWSTLTVIPINILSLALLPYGNIPHLLEFPEPGIVYGWEPWLEIHSSLAEELHLSENDNIEIKTYKQVFKCRIIINENLHQDIGAIPYGMFGLGEGTWVKENMKIPFESLSSNNSDNSLSKGILIQIRKA